MAVRVVRKVRSLKVFKKIFAAAAVLSLALTLVIPVSAVTTVTYGDFDFAVNGDGTFSVYAYRGSDLSPVLPETVFEKPVTGIYDNCFKNSDIESVTIPDSYKKIGKSAFYNCVKLESISIPSGVESIGETAFNGCTALSSVDLSRAVKLSSIPYAAFKGDSSLESVTIPENITAVGAYAFADSGLVSAVLPKFVETLGEYAFRGCAGLLSVTFSDALTEIPAYAFSDCVSLKSAVLPPETVSVGDRAFSGCFALESVDIPSSVTTVGKYAFYDDNSLSELFIPDSVTSIGSYAFSPMAVKNTIKISFYAGSYADTYCHENYVVNTEALGKLAGDADLSGEVDILDVTLIQKYRAGIKKLDNYRALDLADANGDGKVTVRDATTIQMILAKII